MSGKITEWILVIFNDLRNEQKKQIQEKNIEFHLGYMNLRASISSWKKQVYIWMWSSGDRGSCFTYLGIIRLQITLKALGTIESAQREQRSEEQPVAHRLLGYYANIYSKAVISK